MLKQNNSIIFTLFFVSIITASSVILVYLSTKTRINLQQENYQQKMLDIIFPKRIFEKVKTSCFVINNKLLGDDKNHRFWTVKKDNKLQALIFETIAPDGYSGNIKMIISLNLHSTILGIRILNHHETPGLGDKIDIHISNWITKFSGITVSGLNDTHFSLKKYGGDIDQFTGATITPLAVINAIKRTVSLQQMLVSKHLRFKHCGLYHE
ncbi:electron transport complex subunit RsxG [Buchnera aphidicola]|uniref:Ion-translocating oxidoreductase complex subunit G n=1 Tax=Buchnera aphidicola subsp. Melaphis rhois TaxID=118103 RepID=A0A4D6YAI8_BUCMH|nr:electron transport complex subunit RsxG [Buchnera aphidicola]QCI23148.1 electron transport complex subunit RsxG [Buchnera aphidicola (Melaphis rhois)]